MRKVFISYRRSEAEYAAGALGRELRRHFGEAQVFRDKENIGAGASWKQAVLNEIDRDSALLVLIGSQWASAVNAAGQRRLDRDDDPIVLEIADGIDDGATVIPVLLENAVMPGEAELPPKLRAMAEFNALRLRDSDWQHDLERIFKALESAGFKPEPVAGAQTPAPVDPAPRTKSGKVIASYVLGGLTLLAYKETHDADTFWGLAIFALAAFVLAVFAYLDHRKGFSRSKWPSIGAMVLGGVCTLGYVGWAIDPAVQANAALSDAASAPLRALGSPAAPAPAQTPAPAPSAKPAPVAAPASNESNLSGRWTDSDDGTVIMMSQEGERVMMVATLNGLAMQGEGRLAGRQLDMALSMAGVDIGRLQMTLGPQGRRLQGTMNVQGRVERVAFQR